MCLDLYNKLDCYPLHFLVSLQNLPSVHIWPYFVIRYAVLRRSISALPRKRENGSYMEARRQRHEFLINASPFCSSFYLLMFFACMFQFADSWESLINQYHHRSLRPQILFFSSVRYSSIHWSLLLYSLILLW
jgi:hypothetical protein